MSATIFGWSQYQSLAHLPGTSYAKHVLAEGDSWFHFGYTPAIGQVRNLLDALVFEQPTVIANIACSGDTIKQIAELAANPDLDHALAYRKWDLILLSAGGNDLIDALTGNYRIDGRRIEILNRAVVSADFMDYINQANLAALLDHIEAYYRHVAQLRDTAANGLNRDTVIVAHCYDYITARKAPARFLGHTLGPWAWKAFRHQRYRIDAKLWRDITDTLFGALAERLGMLGQSIPGLIVVDTLDTLTRALPDSDGDSMDWANEIHPNAEGYKKLARLKLTAAIGPLLAPA